MPKLRSVTESFAKAISTFSWLTDDVRFAPIVRRVKISSCVGSLRTLDFFDCHRSKADANSIVGQVAEVISD